LALRLTAFGWSYCVLHVGTVFLKHQFPPGLTLGDWVSLLIPWVVMGSALLVWDAIPLDPRREPGARRLLLASSVCYATGYGINLAANAIGRLLPELAPTQPSVLTYFLDEHLGHILWHLGMVGVTAALVQAPTTLGAGRLSWGPGLGAAGYAFAYFTDAVEGQTVALLLPCSLLFAASLTYGPLRDRRTALHRFVLLGHSLALLLFAIWYFWQGGFPQFSDVWRI
jgi:hypothetical protein